MMVSENNEMETIKILQDSLKASVSADTISNVLHDYLEIQSVYSAAIKEVSTKLEILDDDFKYRYKRNPIHSIQSRLKKPQSIMSKLIKKGINDFSTETIREKITDIAGIRVICQYTDDIYTISDLLSKQDDVEVIKISDYIKKPKENGYRSLHMIINIPVFFSDRTERVNVEVQIRTIAMDCWASLEHELKYKNPAYVTPEVKAKLLECAKTITETDNKLQDIFYMVSGIDAEREDI